MTEKVLIEINRLKNELDGYSAREALDYIESYINTLSKQQVEEPVPADLEEAARQYFEEPDNSWEVREVFIAGAKWMEEQLKK